MNVYLMFPDRDFDPRQPLPPNADALIQDLELDTLFDAMARGDDYLFSVAKQALLSSLDSPADILYRQEILRDCLKNPDIVRQIYSLPLQAIERKHRHWMGIFTRYPSGVLSGALQMLEMFVELLKVLKQIADEHGAAFESRGFRRFFAMLQQELDEAYFAEVQEHLERLKFRGGALVSAELGMGNEGTNYVLRKTNHTRNWVQRILSRKSPVYSYSIPPRDDHGARALGELRDRGINLVANAAGQSADHIDSFFAALRLELAFYLGCLNLAERLAELGESVAFPMPVPADERVHSFTGLYDASLSLTMKRKVVGNNVNANGKDLVIITGANQGGKSTFLRSIGLAQLMMQCGMFVPAEAFSANLCRGVFTHYKREEDASMTSGKFDEELSRMSAIADLLSANSLVLFNESFAATNEREGSEIARQIVTALLERRVKVYFVTHQYELANGFYQRGMEDTLFLRAQRQEVDGHRTYKLIEAPPLETSYGIDAYNKVFGEQK